MIFGLLQFHCKLEIEFQSGSNKRGEFKVFASPKENFKIDLSLFRPLTFVEYKGFNGLRPEKYFSFLLNINHPFSQWMIKASSYIYINHRVNYWGLVRSNDFLVVNKIIDKLRGLLPDEFKPEANVNLSESDFR